MSLLQIQTFLQTHHHDILEYYLLEQSIQWIKVISRKTGYIFFVHLFKYQVSLDETDRTPFFVLQLESPDLPMDEFVSDLYQDFVHLFPEMYSKFLLLHSSYLYMKTDERYAIKNVSDSNDLCLFLSFDIETVYEQIHILAYEVEKFYTHISRKIQSHYDHFVASFALHSLPFQKPFGLYHSRLQYYDTQHFKIKKLFLFMCQSEEALKQSLLQLEHESSSVTLVSDILAKSNKKKQCLEKLNQLQVLYIKTFEVLLNTHHHRWKYQLKLIHFLSNLVKHCSSLQNIYSELLEMSSFAPSCLMEDISP